MNSIQKLLRLRQLQSTLKKNPNDTNALVEFFILTNTLPALDQTMNRKVLNRVLSLEPTNQKARLLLLGMDRLDVGAGQS
jgi:CHASE2 domain-containing sensor protein